MESKSELRKIALQRRADIAQRDAKQEWLWERFAGNFSLPAGAWICCYVAKTPEVETKTFLAAALANDRFRLAVPFCDGQDLGLFHLQDWSQLELTGFGLLEPRRSLRVPNNVVACEHIHLFMVPGLAFDSDGNRLGYGKGYYDRLLAKRIRDHRGKPTAPAIALAFDEQIFARVPHDPAFDQPMDGIITPTRLIQPN